MYSPNAEKTAAYRENPDHIDPRAREGDQGGGGGYMCKENN